MAQELADKIRAAAQAKGIDPDIALAIARAESSLRPSAQAGTSSAGGLFQVVDKTWREFGGNPKKKLDADENIRVGTDIIARNTQTLKSFLNRDPRPAEVYAAHYFGPSGAKSFLSADPETPIVDILGKQAVKANPNLQGKNVGQVMAQLEKKMGSGPAPTASVSRETPAVPARQPLPPSLPPMAAAPATEESSAPASRLAGLGPGYQAALALSFLADTDEKEDRDVEKEPGIAEKWLAEQAPRPAALAQFADLSIKSPFAAMEPRQPVQMFNKGGEVEPLTPEEIEAASKPAFLTPKSGIGRQISTKTGELESAAMQGVSEAPYLLAGAPVDLATMAMRPFGYNVEKPMFGSEDLKERALKAGIRQKPPEGKAARALYELTQAGASAVNPAAPVRGAVKAAEKTGEAAKMLARDFGQYNRQLSVPGASYAVRERGTPFMMGYGSDMTVGPDGRFVSMDQPERYVKEHVAITDDPKLNEWLSSKITPYLRRDFATPDDQFVKAADANQLLHFVGKPMKRADLDPYYKRAEYLDLDSFNLPYVRQSQGFSPKGEASTVYGQRAEGIIDASAWPLELGDISSPGLIPPGMRDMVKTNPTARLTEIGTNIDDTLQLPDLALSMAKMRRMPKEYSAYSQPAIKVPDEYMLTDEALVGLTPAQASNRVARFQNWEQEAREKMASKFMNDDPNIDRQELAGGYKAAMLPDLADAPAYKQLAMDVGCDGGWCTRSEQTALDYGSGENRLHMILDKKARPMAQLTLSQISPTPSQLAKDPGAGIKFSVTELKGKGNSTNFESNPALLAIQQHIRNLDRQYDLRYVADLKSLGMKELDPGDLVTGAGKLSALRNRFRPGITAEEYEAAVRPDLADLQAAVRELNEGSKYVTKDRDTKALVEEALQLLAPQQRAFGGMIERR